MINQMNWISNVRVNQGKAGDLTMNVMILKNYVTRHLKWNLQYQIKMEWIRKMMITIINKNQNLIL